jgi:hypothetical protein
MSCTCGCLAGRLGEAGNWVGRSADARCSKPTTTQSAGDFQNANRPSTSDGFARSASPRSVLTEFTSGPTAQDNSCDGAHAEGHCAGSKSAGSRQDDCPSDGRTCHRGPPWTQANPAALPGRWSFSVSGIGFVADSAHLMGFQKLGVVRPIANGVPAISYAPRNHGRDLPCAAANSEENQELMVGHAVNVLSERWHMLCGPARIRNFLHNQIIGAETP